MEVTTKSAEETKELGEKIATDLAISHKQSLALRDKQSLALRDKQSLALRDKQSLALRDKQSLSLRDQPLVIALTGELGSGKTTFVQGLAKGLGIKARIISPTFMLIRKYEIRYTRYERRIADDVLRFASFYHIDLYRLEENVESEVRNLGVEEIWNNPENIVAIEWAEKIEKMIPKSAKWIKFEFSGNKLPAGGSCYQNVSNRLNNAGDRIQLFNGVSEVDCVAYGDGNGSFCGGSAEADVSAPSTGETAARVPDGTGTWAIGFST